MAKKNKKLTFNMKAVSQETGIKPDALRAWERRYGIIEPKRSPGGHRLYTQDDIEKLNWLVARQEEGLAISRAANLWNELTDAGKNPLKINTLEQVLGNSQQTEPLYSLNLPQDNTINEYRFAWLEACKSFNEYQAEIILGQAFALYPPETVCFELLLQGLHEIGDAWYKGEVTVQQEHFASSLAVRRLENLIAASPPTTQTEHIFVGCPPEEDHTFSLLLLTWLLRRHGWKVTYVGANIPLVNLIETLTEINPQLVIMAAQQIPTAATLLQTTTLLHQQKIPMAFGGRIFNTIKTLPNHIPGYYLGPNLASAIQTVKNLLKQSPPLLPPLKKPSETYQQALAQYQIHHISIEMSVWRSLSNIGISHIHLANANRDLKRHITAAMILGDINFLSQAIHWVEGLLINYNFSNEYLNRYLHFYYLATKDILGDTSEPIVTWLAQWEDY